MENWTRVCATLALALAANLVSAEGKPYDPGWKYHVARVSVDVAPDGGTTTTYEMVYTVTAESAIRQIGEQSISYHDHDGSLENVIAYTLKKDGTHIEVPASNVQVTSNNGINGTPPAFSDFMTRQLIYSNVEVGDSVVLSYTLKNVRPTFKNYFSLLHWYSDSYVYDDASYTVTVPAAMKFRQKTYLLDQPSVTAVDHDRQQWKWVYKNPVGRDRRDESQSFERAWHYSELPTIEFSNFADYGQIAAAYQQEATNRSAPTERVRKLAVEIVGDATDPRERAARIYRWVSKEIHFAGNCLTGGDVVPRDTDLILNMKMGDCKDHTTLMQALLAAENIKSTPALINTQEMGYELPEVPCWQAFNPVLNYLPAFDQYADATSSFNPFGTLPQGDRGKPTLHTIDFDHIRHTPVRRYDANFSRAKDVQTITPDGTVDTRDHFQLGGDIANSMSKSFSDWMKSPEFDDGSRYMSQAIERLGYSGEGKYIDMPKLTGPTDAFDFGFAYKVNAYFDLDDPHGVSIASIFPNPSPISSTAQFASGKKFDHDFFCVGDTRTEEMSMSFPDNVKLLAVPHDVHAKTELISFDAIYVRKGNTVAVKRELIDRTPGPICSPDVIEQYATIGAAVKKDQKAQAVYAPKNAH